MSVTLQGRYLQAILAALAMLAPLAFAPGSPMRAAQAQQSTVPIEYAPPPMATVAAKKNCADLAGVDVVAIGGAGSRIEGAAEITSVAGAKVCSVTGTLAPAILFRVDLPTATWTQRYLQTGCGGLCGNLTINVGAADSCPTIQSGGFVFASTDMGHEGMDGNFGRDPQKRADFAYRGVHLTAMAAKALIRAFYGQSEKFSYFDGCSDGGREALVEAERFPADFNGIIAGAPAMNFTIQNSLFHGWQARANTGPDGKAILIASRLPIVHAAVLHACDGLDGTVDGLVSMPAQCLFDPMTVLCRKGQDPSTCLTGAEATTVRKFYDGPRDPKTGERLTQGGPQRGSELQWAGVYVPMTADQPIFSTMIVNSAMPNLIFSSGQPATSDRLAFDRATFDRAAERHTLFDASDPDLSEFAARGGKLILFHGWADPHISPINTIAYHDAVQHFFGSARASGFERLYLMPGMGHCSGGEGPSVFDLLTPMMDWVEQGSAPDAIVTRAPAPGNHIEFGTPGTASRESPSGARRRPTSIPMGVFPKVSSPVRSRPVYPYPYVAAFNGTGDQNTASNWHKGKAAPAAVPSWAGTNYY